MSSLFVGSVGLVVAILRHGRLGIGLVVTEAGILLSMLALAVGVGWGVHLAGMLVIASASVSMIGVRVPSPTSSDGGK